MKIVLITQDFYPLTGGIASYLMQIYNKYFSKEDFEVIIPEFIDPHYKTDSLPFKVHRTNFTPFDLKNSRRDIANLNILNILKEIKPDVILFGYLRSHPEVGLLYKKINSSSKFGIFIHAKEAFIDSTIVDVNSKDGRYQKGYTLDEAKFYKDILMSADFVFSVSNFSKQLLQSQGINRKIDVVHPSIDLNNIRLNLNAKSELSLKNKFVLLSVGRLIRRKNHRQIILLMPELLKVFNDFHYIIVGDGPEFDSLNKLISDLKLENNVSVWRNVSEENISLFYSACDLFLFPSIFLPPNDVEGFGIVLLEAEAYGKPVIGFDYGGVSESIVDQVTGYLISNSSEDLKNKILALFEDSSLREKLGATGRLRVLKEFSSKESDYLINKITEDNSRS